MSTVSERVVEIEKLMWTKSDKPETFEEAMADEAISVIEPMGIVTKPDAIRMSKEAKPFTDVEIKDVTVRELTPDCVALAYHGEGNMVGLKERYKASICSVYIKQDGDWKLGATAHQPWKPRDNSSA